MNFELGTRDATFGFDEEREARLSPERVWLRKTRGKMERFSVESCVGGYHVYKARTPLGSRIPEREARGPSRKKSRTPSAEIQTEIQKSRNPI